MVAESVSDKYQLSDTALTTGASLASNRPHTRYPAHRGYAERVSATDTSAPPRTLDRSRLFLVSYFPLWLMLAFRIAPTHVWCWSDRTLLASLFFLLAVWSFVDARRLVAGARQTGANSYYFSDISDQGGNAAGYLATYLLPFLGIVPTAWGDWVAYGIYFLVAAIVFIRTDLSLVNPTLYILGWRIVSARAFLDPDHSPDQQVGVAPVIVLCKDSSWLRTGAVEVVTLAGCYVAKRAPTA